MFFLSSFIGRPMILLSWHLLTGAQLRAQLIMIYRSDVWKKGSIECHGTEIRHGTFRLSPRIHVPVEELLCVLLSTRLVGHGCCRNRFHGILVGSDFIFHFPSIYMYNGIRDQGADARMFGMRQHYVMDFLALFFCYWCALVQEFKFMERVFEVERNRERGVEICPRIPVASPVGET